MDAITVEMVIWKEKVRAGLLEKYVGVTEKHLVSSNDQKTILQVKHDWEGFKDGTVTNMMNDFGDSLYISLAYTTVDESERVVDFDGTDIQSHPTVHGQTKALKYVKKRLCVIKEKSFDEGIYEVKAYALNMKYTAPVLKVLEVKTYSKEGMELLQKLPINGIQ